MSSFIKGEQPPYKIVSFVVTFAKMFNDNMSFCGYQQMITDLDAFCYDGTKCNNKQLIRNMSGRTFQFVGDANAIVATLQRFPPIEEEEMLLDSLDLGINVGKIIRNVYNYDK